MKTDNNSNDTEFGSTASLSACSYCGKAIDFFQAGEAIIEGVHILCCEDCFPRMQEHAKEHGWDGESIG